MDVSALMKLEGKKAQVSQQGSEAIFRSSLEEAAAIIQPADAISYSVC